MSPQLTDLERERIRIKSRLKILMWVILVVFLPIVIWGFTTGGFILAILFAGTGLLLYAVGYQKSLKFFRKKYKSSLINTIVSALGRHYRYDADCKPDEDVLRNCGLFGEYNGLICKGDLQGEFDQYSFSLKDLEIANKIVRIEYRDGVKRKVPYKIRVHKGLFFEGTFAVRFPADIMIFSKINNPSQNKIMKMMSEEHSKAVIERMAGYDRVSTSDEDFNAGHDVLSSDGNIAGMLLQQVVIDRIKELESRVLEPGSLIKLAFKGNKVYIALAQEWGLFEPSIDKTLTDMDVFRENFSPMAAFLEFFRWFIKSEENESVA